MEAETIFSLLLLRPSVAPASAEEMRSASSQRVFVSIYKDGLPAVQAQ